jgi:predicted permease
MTPLHAWQRRLRALFNRAGSEQDLSDEMRFHLEMEAAQLARDGAPAPDARREARRRFGSVDRYTEELRDERGGRRLDAMAQDLRYALRLVRRSPAFASMVVLTLGLAIGATTAVFSVVNAVLLRPLPFARPDELVRVYAQNPDASQPRFSVSHADYLDWRRETQSFANLALFGNTTLTIAGDGEPERLSGLVVTSNFFDVFETRPALGRLFATGDEDGNASASVILANGFWRRRFGADSSIVGRSVPFAGRARVVIGVLPERFDFDGRPIDAVIVLAPAGIPGGQNHGQHLFESVARLKPRVTPEQAQLDLRTVAAHIAATHPDVKDWTANVFSFQAELVRGTQNPLLILLGASALVLLIGCINVANLLSVRAATRGREVGLRQALGASRGRLVSQLLIESGVLAAIGGTLGLIIAIAGTRVMFTLVPVGLLPRFTGSSVDASVLAFAAALSMLTALVVGLWPALRATDPAVARTLREGGRGSTGGAHGIRVRRALVVAEMSLALVLLVCSGLVLQSLNNIVNVDPGFRVDGISTMRLTLSGPRYPNDTAQIQFYRELLSRLSARPGIDAVAAANTPPIAGGGIVTPIRLPGRVTAPSEQLMSPVTGVTPGYFRTMSMRIIRGRDVSWTDPTATIVASEAAAKKLWPGEDPIGKRVAFGRQNDGLEVIGVVSDAHARGLVAEPTPMLYMSYDGAANIARTMSLVVRGSAPPAAIVATTKAVLHEIDPSLPVYAVRTVREVVDQSIAQPRLNTTLLTVFASLALLLAGIGIYGVVSFSVTQRVQEFGVRMALGAQRGDVMRLVLREGAVLVSLGIVIGSAGAMAATAAIRSWLFGVGRGDPVTFIATALMLGAIAFAATYIPARRATKVDPVLAMRGE